MSKGTKNNPKIASQNMILGFTEEDSITNELSWTEDTIKEAAWELWLSNQAMKNTWTIEKVAKMNKKNLKVNKETVIDQNVNNIEGEYSLDNHWKKTISSGEEGAKENGEIKIEKEKPEDFVWNNYETKLNDTILSDEMEIPDQKNAGYYINLEQIQELLCGIPLKTTNLGNWEFVIYFKDIIFNLNWWFTIFDVIKIEYSNTMSDIVLREINKSLGNVIKIKNLFILNNKLKWIDAPKIVSNDNFKIIEVDKLNWVIFWILITIKEFNDLEKELVYFNSCRDSIINLFNIIFWTSISNIKIKAKLDSNVWLEEIIKIQKEDITNHYFKILTNYIDYLLKWIIVDEDNTMNRLLNDLTNSRYLSTKTTNDYYINSIVNKYVISDLQENRIFMATLNKIIRDDYPKIDIKTKNKNELQREFDTVLIKRIMYWLFYWFSEINWDLKKSFVEIDEYSTFFNGIYNRESKNLKTKDSDNSIIVNKVIKLQIIINYKDINNYLWTIVKDQNSWKNNILDYIEFIIKNISQPLLLEEIWNVCNTIKAKWVVLLKELKKNAWE